MSFAKRSVDWRTPSASMPDRQDQTRRSGVVLLRRIAGSDGTPLMSGLSLASVSMEVSARMPSSWANSNGSPFFCGTEIGTTQIYSSCDKRGKSNTSSSGYSTPRTGKRPDKVGQVLAPGNRQRSRRRFAFTPSPRDVRGPWTPGPPTLSRRRASTSLPARRGWPTPRHPESYRRAPQRTAYISILRFFRKSAPRCWRICGSYRLERCENAGLPMTTTAPELDAGLLWRTTSGRSADWPAARRGSSGCWRADAVGCAPTPARMTGDTTRDGVSQAHCG